MATVRRARDPNSDREVAIKLLPREMLHNPEFRDRFKRELKIISALEHPAIVPVYDSGEEDGQPYFVMRYMMGGSLSERLKRGKLSLMETASIVEKLASGLDYAHQKGIVHRDLKPDNVLFDSNGNPYLSDFGVAKLLETAYSDTGSGILGTPAYMSPEQAGGENDKIDYRSDIYGLGVLVYQMLTGKQPYHADTPMGVLVKHITEPMPNILDANRDLPPMLETIIKTATAKNREDRYQSVLEFTRALSVAAFGPERTMPSALVLERRHLAASTRRRAIWTIGGAIVLLALIGGYFYFLNIALLSAPTATASILPSIAPSITVAPTITSTVPIPTATLTLTSTPSAIPTPNGGADHFAVLSGNKIYTMNMDGSNPVVVDSENFEKSNLQWITDDRLVYISPVRNCAYVLDLKNRTPAESLCFKPLEKLEGFQVSPDGNYVAISIDRVLYITPFDVDQLKGQDSRFLLAQLNGTCSYSQSIKDVLWPKDGKHLAALTVDTQQRGSDQIYLFDLDPQQCNSSQLVPTDIFPATHFAIGSTTIPSYDWDGDHLFLLNDFKRNNGFGDLYLYDSETQTGKVINPINGVCCYRDAHWSPDGRYILFLYQNRAADEISIYFVSYIDLQSGKPLTPIRLSPGLLQSRDTPQLTLRPAR